MFVRGAPLFPWVLLLLVACTSVEEVTSPPTFRRLGREEIHSAMQAMAQNVAVLDDALRDGTRDPVRQQREVLSALDGVLAAARALQPGGVTVSHPMLQEKLPQFLVDIEHARAAAALDPPQYFLAGSVSGSCMACHRR